MAQADEPTFARLRQAAITKLFDEAFVVRLAGPPVLCAVVLIVSIADGEPWRIGTLTALLVGHLVISFFELERFRRGGVTQKTLVLDVATMTVATLALVVASGGIESPLLPVIIPAALIASALLSARGTLLVAIVLVTAVAGLAWLHGSLPDRPLVLGVLRDAAGGPSRGELVATVFASAFFVGVAAFGGRRLRRAFDRAMRRGVEARDEALQGYGAEVRTLGALAFDLARALRDPLDRIERLADAETRATGAESMRQELGRMRTVLDELTTFSRPFTPLSQESVTLTPLCREVASLCEGLALAREVSIHCVGDQGAHVRCDRRKVKQALLSLVENAVEASPIGGCVELAIAVRDGGAVMSVGDLGNGVPADLGERVFEPGVSAKPGGAGFGLTVARALARQHGGEVTLRHTPKGTCAEFVLPDRHERDSDEPALVDDEGGAPRADRGAA